MAPLHKSKFNLSRLNKEPRVICREVQHISPSYLGFRCIKSGEKKHLISVCDFQSACITVENLEEFNQPMTT